MKGLDGSHRDAAGRDDSGDGVGVGPTTTRREVVVGALVAEDPDVDPENAVVGPKKRRRRAVSRSSSSASNRVEPGVLCRPRSGSSRAKWSRKWPAKVVACETGRYLSPRHRQISEAQRGAVSPELLDARLAPRKSPSGRGCAGSWRSSHGNRLPNASTTSTSRLQAATGAHAAMASFRRSAASMAARAACQRAQMRMLVVAALEGLLHGVVDQPQARRAPSASARHVVDGLEVQMAALASGLYVQIRAPSRQFDPCPCRRRSATLARTWQSRRRPRRPRAVSRGGRTRPRPAEPPLRPRTLSWPFAVHSGCPIGRRRWVDPWSRSPQGVARATRPPGCRRPGRRPARTRRTRTGAATNWRWNRSKAGAPRHDRGHGGGRPAARGVERGARRGGGLESSSSANRRRHPGGARRAKTRARASPGRNRDLAPSPARRPRRRPGSRRAGVPRVPGREAPATLCAKPTSTAGWMPQVKLATASDLRSL